MTETPDSVLQTMLRCPTTGAEMQPAAPELIDRINRLIAEQSDDVRDGFDQKVKEPIDGGWVCEDGARLSPIRNHVTSLVSGDSIDISKL